MTMRSPSPQTIPQATIQSAGLNAPVSPHPNLAVTQFFDHDSPEVAQFVAKALGDSDGMRPREKAVKLGPVDNLREAIRVAARFQSAA